MSCIFCGIAAGRIPSTIVHQDDEVLAFRDINPQASTHVVVVPRRHIASLADVTPGDEALLGRMVRIGRDLAQAEGLGERGFRLVMNAGEDAGYSVFHIHLHVIGGRRLGWPPG